MTGKKQMLHQSGGAKAKRSLGNCRMVRFTLIPEEIMKQVSSLSIFLNMEMEGDCEQAALAPVVLTLSLVNQLKLIGNLMHISTRS